MSRHRHSESDRRSYTVGVPKLWSESIDAHRRGVTSAILDATADLVSDNGPLSVTMSKVAERAGIGRATLYKYFSDVEEVLLAWHERQVSGHLEQLSRTRDGAADAGQRLAAVLHTYALIRSQQPHGSDVSAFLHQGEHVTQAHGQLRDLVRDLIIEGAATGDFRNDVPPAELASYCLHALATASSLPSKAAVQRLVTVTLDALQPRR